MGKRRTEGREKRGQSKGDLGEVITTRGSLGLEGMRHGHGKELPMPPPACYRKKKKGVTRITIQPLEKV